ncbi:MAG: hypothetical protein H6767_08455 [Candidatus Peribacteria bacterium]|nr:MAG: hypothetical protein H6767_08455 [Candidatus Peribacteria bacterium]
MNGVGTASISVWVKADITGHDRGILYGRDPDGFDRSISLRYDVDGFIG